MFDMLKFLANPETILNKIQADIGRIRSGELQFDEWMSWDVDYKNCVAGAVFGNVAKNHPTMAFRALSMLVQGKVPEHLDAAARARSEVMLWTAALGFAAAVQHSSDPPTEADVQAHRGRCETLYDAALQFAAAAGSIDAAERAELHALRWLRDGVVCLRGELCAGAAAADPVALAVETIDGLIATASVQGKLPEQVP